MAAQTASPPGSRRVGRWLPATALVVGGLLVFMAQFLPWESLTYYQTLSDGTIVYQTNGMPQPIYTTYLIPAQGFPPLVADDQQLYGHVTAGTLLIGFLMFGLPVVLMALGVAAFWARRRLLRWLLFVPSLIFWLVGAGITLYEIGLSGFYGMDSCCHGSVTQTYGTLVVSLGFGSALLGVLLILRSQST